MEKSASSGVWVGLSVLAVVGAAVAWSQVAVATHEIRALRLELEQSRESLRKVEKEPCAATPPLGERMNVLARRLAAVWYAGTNGNKALAKYELHEMEEMIESIELLHPIENGVNVANVLEAVAETQLCALGAAVESGDQARFRNAYADTMEACNACHASAGRPFVRIAMPSAPPVPNRLWTPPEEPPRAVIVSDEAR